MPERRRVFFGIIAVGSKAFSIVPQEGESGGTRVVNPCAELVRAGVVSISADFSGTTVWAQRVARPRSSGLGAVNIVRRLPPVLSRIHLTGGAGVSFRGTDNKMVRVYQAWPPAEVRLKT